MEAKLIKKSENYYELYEVRTNLTLLIGSTDSEKKIDVYGKDAHKLLSLKNCQAIERGYDLDELAELEAEKRHDWDDHDDTDIYNELIREDAELIKIGMQKILEILGNKKFSEEDMINFAEYCKGDLMKTKDLFNEYQSLQQTEWEVSCNPDVKDADGNLILKRK